MNTERKKLSPSMFHVRCRSDSEKNSPFWDVTASIKTWEIKKSPVGSGRTEDRRSVSKIPGRQPPLHINRKCDRPQSRVRRYGENEKLLVLTGSRNTIPKYPVLVWSFYTMKRDVKECRIQSHLPHAGIIRSSPYSPR